MAHTCAQARRLPGAAARADRTVQMTMLGRRISFGACLALMVLLAVVEGVRGYLAASLLFAANGLLVCLWWVLLEGGFARALLPANPLTQDALRATAGLVLAFVGLLAVLMASRDVDRSSASAVAAFHIEAGLLPTVLSLVFQDWLGQVRHVPLVQVVAQCFYAIVWLVAVSLASTVGLDEVEVPTAVAGVVGVALVLANSATRHCRAGSLGDASVNVPTRPTSLPSRVPNSHHARSKTATVALAPHVTGVPKDKQRSWSVQSVDRPMVGRGTPARTDSMPSLVCKSEPEQQPGSQFGSRSRLKRVSIDSSRSNHSLLTPSPDILRSTSSLLGGSQSKVRCVPPPPPPPPPPPHAWGGRRRAGSGVVGWMDTTPCVCGWMHSTNTHDLCAVVCLNLFFWQLVMTSEEPLLKQCVDILVQLTTQVPKKTVRVLYSAAVVFAGRGFCILPPSLPRCLPACLPASLPPSLTCFLRCRVRRRANFVTPCVCSKPTARRRRPLCAKR